MTAPLANVTEDDAPRRRQNAAVAAPPAALPFTESHRYKLVQNMITPSSNICPLTGHVMPRPVYIRLGRFRTCTSEAFGIFYYTMRGKLDCCRFCHPQTDRADNAAPDPSQTAAIDEARDKYKHKKVNCDICGRTLASWAGLRRHYTNLHPTFELKVKCQTCGKAFDTPKQLCGHGKACKPPTNSKADTIAVPPAKPTSKSGTGAPQPRKPRFSRDPNNKRSEQKPTKGATPHPYSSTLPLAVGVEGVPKETIIHWLVCPHLEASRNAMKVTELATRFGRKYFFSYLFYLWVMGVTGDSPPSEDDIALAAATLNKRTTSTANEACLSSTGLDDEELALNLAFPAIALEDDDDEERIINSFLGFLD